MTKAGFQIYWKKAKINNHKV